MNAPTAEDMKAIFKNEEVMDYLLGHAWANDEPKQGDFYERCIKRSQMITEKHCPPTDSKDQ